MTIAHGPHRTGLPEQAPVENRAWALKNALDAKRVDPMPPRVTLKKRRGPLVRTSSSTIFRSATTLESANAACCCPAVSGSVSRSLAR